MDRFLKRKTVESNTQNSASTSDASPAQETTPGTNTDRDTARASDKSAKKKRLFKFSNGWKVDRPWLEFDEAGGKMYCTVCRDFGRTKHNKFVEGCDSLRIDSVRAHENSSIHKGNNTAMLNSKLPQTEQPIVRCIMNMEKHDEMLMKRLFRTAFYLANQEKAYTDFKSLNELQQKNFGNEDDSASAEISAHYNSDKQANTFVKYIAMAERQCVLEKVNTSEFISVALDGSTDSGNLEQELFYVSFLDENCDPHIKFLKIKSIQGRATAEGLKDCLYQTFQDMGIDLKDKCVQLSTDGPSVMKKMCQNVQENITFLLTFHCSNHRLELAFKDAIKDIEIHTEIHELLNGLHYFYHNSNLQTRMLNDTGKLLGINTLVHPTAKGTRWVAHQERALQVVNRNYSANVSQLQECHLDRSQRQDTRAKAAGLRDKLLIKNNVVFMLAILRPLLAIIACLSCLLQSEDVSIDSLVSTVRRAKTKLNQFNCVEKVNSFQQSEISENNVFRDTQLQVKRTRHLNNETDVINQSEKLLDNLKKTITDRFGLLDDGNLGDEITSSFSVFDVCNLPDSDETDNLQTYGKTEIQELVEHFADLLESKGYDPSVIEDERVSLWEYVLNVLKHTTKDGKTIKKFWPKILRRKGSSPELKNILALVKILLVLTFSTAFVERGFSLMNRIKSDWRSRLNEDSLNDLMTVSMSPYTITNFDPMPAIKLWWLASNKPRRLVDAYGPHQTKS